MQVVNYTGVVANVVIDIGDLRSDFLSVANRLFGKPEVAESLYNTLLTYAGSGNLNLHMYSDEVGQLMDTINEDIDFLARDMEAFIKDDLEMACGGFYTGLVNKLHNVGMLGTDYQSSEGYSFLLQQVINPDTLLISIVRTPEGYIDDYGISKFYSSRGY